MKELPLNKWHKKYGKMEEYANWEMPVWYDGIKQEHLAVRKNVGIFDVSHMGEIIFSGKDALKFLQLTTTNDISRPPPISGTYTLVLNERGSVKDETLVYNLGKDTYMMVCDAVAVPKLVSYFLALKEIVDAFGPLDLAIKDETDATCLFSIQGPLAQRLCDEMFSIDLTGMWWFQAKAVKHEGMDIILSKSGYTGENGFELFFKPADPSRAIGLWDYVMECGKEFSITPCGIGARDTLRIESGYTLYGHETYEAQLLSTWVDEVTPLQAGLDFALHMDKEFIGKEALLRQGKEGIRTKLAHFELGEKAIPRSGDGIFKDGRQVGSVTSGTKTPILSYSIAMGYVETGTEGDVDIEIRGKLRKAKIVNAPFYNPKRYGAYRET
ncbi:MAG TPA: glycine cleavage system aminomethyltransferase GcvT [Candidatus Methanofastidiosa archaeon]|nr:glycine cleavage system aminomethyltransferase GcvT [Candidatus Methanofastidiosa archaeon]